VEKALNEEELQVNDSLKTVELLLENANDCIQQTLHAKVENALNEEELQVNDSLKTVELLLENANDCIQQTLHAKGLNWHRPRYMLLRKSCSLPSYTVGSITIWCCVR